MPHTLAERRSDRTQNDETRVALRLVEWEVFPPTHPALPRLRPGRLRFAPAPAQGTDEQGTDEPVAPAHRERRMDWKERGFEAGWIALTLACAAEGIYRLLWAVQP